MYICTPNSETKREYLNKLLASAVAEVVLIYR